jgi:hypothetical protein
MLDAMGVDYARVLDLYAGSGALGIEALSRGDGTADFVESDAGAAATIAANLAITGFEARFSPLRPRGAPFRPVHPRPRDPHITMSALEAVGRSPRRRRTAHGLVLEHTRVWPRRARAAGLYRTAARDTSFDLYGRMT